MIDDLEVWIELAARQKLCFKVSSFVRCIFMAIDLPTVHFLAHYTREPTEDDRELLSDIPSELKGEFMEIKNIEVVCEYSDKSFGELEKLKFWLFVRAEEMDESKP